MGDEPSLRVILPRRHMDQLSDHLVELTGAIDKLDPDLVAHGLLGGEHAYGGTWDSPIFQMHPFCWCERQTCPWCAGCECPEGSYHYFVDGQEVSYAEWSAFYNQEVYARATGGRVTTHEEYFKLPYDPKLSAKVLKLGEAANKRRNGRGDKVCDFCRGTMHEDRGFVAERGAPNFWHKPSGLKVWWYKYIGRSQEVIVGNDWKLKKVFAECLSDVSNRKDGSTH